METIRITTSQNIDIDYEVAGLGDRILASLLDYCLLFVVYIFAAMILGAIASQGEAGIYIVLIIYLVIYGFYDLVCELILNGQSVGKLLMKIRVISLDGAKPRIGQYILRWLMRIPDFLLTMGVCALTAVAVTEKKQRLGDLVAGTILVRTVPRAQLLHLAYKAHDETYQPVYHVVTLLSDKDIELVHEVVNTYYQTNNPEIVYALAAKVKSHLGISQVEGMHELALLQTVIKDYTFLTSVSRN